MSDLILINAAVGAAACLGLALIVLKSSRRSIVRWSFAAGMLALATEAICVGMSMYAVSPAEVVRWFNGGLIAMAVVPAPWFVFSSMFARADVGRFDSVKRSIALGALVVPVGIGLWFWDVLLTGVTQVPESRQLYYNLGPPGLALHIILLVGAVAILMNLERTFRASVGTIRWRIKFMLLGLGVLFVVRIYTSSQVLLFSAMKASWMVINLSILPVACLLILRSLFREGLFNVTVYPSRAVLQNSVTVLSVGIYLLLVGVLAKIVTAVGGDAAFPLKAFFVLVALAGLTTLLLSDRIRQRTRSFISRHFSRPLHDYQKVWLSFTERTTSLMKEDELCGAVTRLVSDIFEVLSVTVWQIDERNEKLVIAASTVFSESAGQRLSEIKCNIAELRDALAAQSSPVNIDAAKENWVGVLKRCSPDQFTTGGSRVCVPLIAGEKVMGLIMLGDRVSGLPFTVEDFELLKCIGDQVAANLQRIQLSERLLEAREMEAFQAMSAFFVHDLKNTASTLSLMLRNLPTHFEDPEFRADALRAVGKSVERINSLITRFSLLRQTLQTSVRETDLNELISDTLAGLGGSDKTRLSTVLEPLPKISIDPEQVQKVVTNLVLNAWESVSVDRAGEVRVTSSRQDKWAVISVSDNGCGMTPEFVSRSLFRPFQTTKKKGIGIGMFHSKAIVEAHRGKIEVASEPGKGTTFRVLLPYLENS